MREAEKSIERSVMEDIELITVFKAGDKTAFDTLVLRHKDMVFNLCYRFLGDFQDANDTAQDVFIKAYKALKRFRAESSFSTWIYRIALNTCKNRIKSLEHRYWEQTRSLDNPGKSGNDNPPMEIADDSPSPPEALESKERSMIIQKAIHSLPKAKKEMVLLRDMEGLSYEEIMNITGLNIGTVKSKIARARSDLREKLKGVI
jgi:RNA polymerase sigma-70 factor (ECF subfamily)